MTATMIEFVRPDGTLLRILDAGFDFIDAAGIPYSNAERPVRVSASGTLFSETIPLPDGEDTVLRIAAKGLAVTGANTSLRVRVLIGGEVCELTLKVAVELSQSFPQNHFVQSPAQVTPDKPRSIPPPLVPATQNSLAKCPNCGAELVPKQIAVGTRFRKFLACPGYPICRYTRDLPRT